MKKNVGVLSMQRVVNYGSFLQAYALKELLKKAGAEEVYFIDIRPGRQLEDYNIADISGINKIKTFLSNIFLHASFQPIRRVVFFRKLRKKFVDSYYYMLGLDKILPKHFDLIVIGSDEVFNFSQKTPWGFTTQLYGDVNADRVVSYAGSFGNTSMQNIEKYKVVDELKAALKKMSFISVRDENSACIITALTDSKPYIHLDPVLIYDYTKEIDSAKGPCIKNYIIIYSYQDRICDKQEIEAIRSFAKKQNKKLVSIFCTYPWCDKTIMPDTPFDVLAWFKQADYVITDTFHGTIFAIINCKKFGSLIRTSNKEKLEYLLQRLHLRERIVESLDKMELVLLRDIDYAQTKNIIRHEREHSIKYLKNVLN